MINRLTKAFFLNVWFLWIACSVQSQTVPVFTVKANEIKGVIQPTMWGIFFEDINLAADGGVYAELVKNRSFEFAMPMMGWKELKKDGGNGSILVLNLGSENENNPRFIRAAVTSDKGGYGLSNEGFRGMGIKANNQYDFSILAKGNKGSNVVLNIELVNENGNKIGGASFSPTGDQWKKYQVSFTATATEPKAKLNIWFQGKGSIDMDMISLFPKDTWKNRPGGLRADLIQLLADLKPGFLRFPGGCIVEGRDLANRYQWKKNNWRC
jgi:alpha-L-arabinofuranosidase